MKYRRKAVYTAVRISAPMTLETPMGPIVGQPGQWLVEREDGQRCFINDERFTAEFEKVVQRKAPIRKDFDLETAYEMYPRKEGKRLGLERLSRSVQTQEDYDLLLQAIDRYRRSETVKKGFIKLFSSFASSWRDWTDENAGKVEGQPTFRRVELEGL